MKKFLFLSNLWYKGLITPYTHYDEPVAQRQE
jgi:hypothetical protein